MKLSFACEAECSTECVPAGCGGRGDIPAGTSGSRKGNLPRSGKGFPLNRNQIFSRVLARMCGRLLLARLGDCAVSTTSQQWRIRRIGEEIVNEIKEEDREFV